ncbi:hypothetical protein LA080_005494 [Diaporthe eres]|nr:hypothetical protein LA080_005494 [Diaporthe eres]
MIGYISATFYEELVTRDGPGGLGGCENGSCTANGTAAIEATKTQWEKFSQGAKIGIIIGAAVGATLLLNILAS